MKITLPRGLAIVGTVSAALGVAVNQAYLSTAFTLGLTATDFGLISGFAYLVAVIVWASERY